MAIARLVDMIGLTQEQYDTVTQELNLQDNPPLG